MKATKKILILGRSSFDDIVYLNEFPQPLPQTIHKTTFCEVCDSTGTGQALAVTDELLVYNILSPLLLEAKYNEYFIVK